MIKLQIFGGTVQNLLAQNLYTHCLNTDQTKLNSVALVREWTIPTERPPPVGEVSDRLCGLVVRVSGYRYRGLGFDSRRYQIF